MVSVVLCFILNSCPKFTLPVAVYFAAKDSLWHRALN